MVAATAVDVGALGTVPNVIPAGNLQVALGQIFGKAVYAADQVGAATYKADHAQATADGIAGTAQYAADKAGYLEYHMQQIADLVGYTGMTPARSASLEEHKQVVFEEAVAAGVAFAEEAQAARQAAAEEAPEA